MQQKPNVGLSEGFRMCRLWCVNGVAEFQLVNSLYQPSSAEVSPGTSHFNDLADVLTDSLFDGLGLVVEFTGYCLF